MTNMLLAYTLLLMVWNLFRKCFACDFCGEICPNGNLQFSLLCCEHMDASCNILWCCQVCQQSHFSTYNLVYDALSQALKNAGGVPFIRTNIPQTMMSLAGHNPIYGQTRNPHDVRRSPGGSSAGEGAGIGAGASMFGIGSDIGTGPTIGTTSLFGIGLNISMRAVLGTTPCLVWLRYRYGNYRYHPMLGIGSGYI